MAGLIREVTSESAKNVLDSRALAATSSTEELVELASRGETGAQQALVRRLRPRLVRQLKSLGWLDDAEDLAHDALIILLCRIRTRRLDDPSMVFAFCAGIASRLSIGRYRKLNRQKTVIDSDLVEACSDDECSPERSAMREQVREAVASLINQLNQPRDRTILKRMYIDGGERHLVRNELAMTAPQFDRVLHRSKQRLGKLAANYQSYAELGVG